MSEKVKNLNEHRRKKKPRTLEEAAKSAVRRYCDPDLLNSIEEPEGLASGKTNESGGFVNEEDPEEKDNDEQK